MEPVNNPPISKGILIGVDIGQRVDNTAIVVAEKQLRDYFVRPFDDWQSVSDARQTPQGGDIHYVVRYIGRMPLHTSYKKVAERVGEIYHQLPAKNIIACRIDATGVGQPVVDLVKEQGIRVTAVYLTGGQKAVEMGDELHLAKEPMVSRAQVLLQQHFIHMPDNDPEARAAADELLNYEIIVTPSANLKTGVFKVGAHDDLATALMLAIWEGEDRTIGTFYMPKWFSDYRG